MIQDLPLVYVIALPPHLTFVMSKNFGGKLDKGRRENLEEVALVSGELSNNGQGARVS